MMQEGASMNFRPGLQDGTLASALTVAGLRLRGQENRILKKKAPGGRRELPRPSRRFMKLE